MKTALLLSVVLAAAAADPLAELKARDDSEVPPIEPRTTLDCGRHRLNAGTYIIESPDHPDDYPNSYRCKWVLMARDRSEITMTCSAFDLEDHRRCRYDFLKIGRTKYCGTNTPPAVSGTKLKVLFKTDGDTVSSGFRLLLLRNTQRRQPHCRWHGGDPQQVPVAGGAADCRQQHSLVRRHHHQQPLHPHSC